MKEFHKYTGSQSKEAVMAAMIKYSEKHPGWHVYFHCVFQTAWLAKNNRLDPFACGEQASDWVGGYALNGQFKPFTEKQIIWEQNQGIIAQ